MNRFLTALLGALIPITLPAQGYISYFSGDTTDVETPTSGGVVLMGGATENDNAMRWFLQRAGGGDVVVIRASGADGYNDYLFSKLGVPVNSVQSIVTPSLSAANLPYVARQIRNAEALWIAGGDQWRYLSYWKNGPVAEALDFLIHTKKAVVGGTSAGMAVLGEACFSAQNGTV
ncbi:MAG: Type 1 glutamine amidotransferase-like domain-containing protein, partial [Saprospiraceae bacterium]|nr:Type 1 glutamine amidotransferase-like domain-containing protein [Saprospiraceae bacterium]